MNPHPRTGWVGFPPPRIEREALNSSLAIAKLLVSISCILLSNTAIILLIYISTVEEGSGEVCNIV